MNETIPTQTKKSETQMNGYVPELEFQVSTVLNRLEEAVEKFDSKGTVSSLAFNQALTLTPKSSHDIINIIQDAIVNLNLSKEDEEPNLAILPALRDVDKLALLSHSIKQYIQCLDVAHSDYLINWIENETSYWIVQLFGSEGFGVFYDESYLEGCSKLLRLLLLKKYPTYSQDGFESLKQSEPVIYYNTPATFVIAQYICSCNGLPLRFVQEVPSFTSKKNDDLEVFRRILEENTNKQQVPLLFLAGADTQTLPSRCSTKALRHLCKEHNIWLHLIGNSIAVLPILRKRREEQTILFDSITVTLGPWLNIPTLPTAIIHNISEDDRRFLSSIDVENKRPLAVPLWTSIQCLGQEGIINDFIQKFESCQRLYDKLEKNSSLKMLSQPPGDGNISTSIADLITKPLTETDVFELVISSVVFKFLPENNELWPSSYCDKLNSWLSQVLQRELPVVPISTVELEEHGTSLRYSPFSNTLLISDWSSFYACLDQQLDILKSTVAQKETLYKLIQNSTCLKLVELPDWAGLGGVRYFPEAWNRDDFAETHKEEVNRLNFQIVQQLRNTDSAFSIGESPDGYSCIRFGMVGWDSDVMDLISLVETVGKQEEESWNFIDTMAEVVKKGIETAILDLQKESEEKLWQEGILRHVPVFGNIVNWWSPINKDNGGIKGRSLDLTAGVIESTENIYRYHMQGATKTSAGVKPPPQPSIQTPLTPNGTRKLETEDEVQTS